MSGSTKKRLLEPRYTDGYVHVPHLREKLTNVLYGHPRIQSNRELAAELGISPATLSTWLNGTRYEDEQSIGLLNPDSIRTPFYPKFVGIWGLPRATLELEDFAAFRAAVPAFEAGRSAWDKLVRAVAEDAAVEIVVQRTRGLIDPDDEEDPSILQLDRGDAILIRVPRDRFSHGLMLLQDRSGWSCLRPNTRWQETEIVDEFLVFPRQMPDRAQRFSRLDNVGGVHRLLAILSMEPFPAIVADVLLNEPLDPSGLDSIANHLHKATMAGDGRCRMVSRRFVVRL
jgi:hypothetical protein